MTTTDHAAGTSRTGELLRLDHPLAAALSPLTPYTPPIARHHERCVCGGSGSSAEETLCRPCRDNAVAEHGERLTHLLRTISYDHRGVRLRWTDAGPRATAFTPRVSFLMPDIHDPSGPHHTFRAFEYWEDDQLITACVKGASDQEILALALSMAHYVLVCVALHEVGEWLTYRSAQVYPPHRLDPCFPLDEDRGPDGNGQVVAWLSYAGPAAAEADQPGDTPIRPEHSLPLAEEDLGVMPGQKLHLTPQGIHVSPPGDAATTTFPWTARRPGEDALAAALRDIHYALGTSELSVVAEHLKVAGKAIFTTSPAALPTGSLLTWDVYLTYDA
ncbi:hypothetical protein ABT117_24875 [Streptomyces sp. NPDC002262]|uniref:hypothetical protein n=1 Tax=Streptomyces sp. NPDC002262 TaxID=3154414 RepID=UPI00332C7A77